MSLNKECLLIQDEQKPQMTPRYPLNKFVILKYISMSAITGKEMVLFS